MSRTNVEMAEEPSQRCRSCRPRSIGNMCCCKQNRHYLRVWMLWAFVHIPFLCVGTAIAMVTLMPPESELSPHDMQYVGSRLSSVFCAGVDIKAEEEEDGRFFNEFSVFLLSDKPVMDETNKQTFDTSVTLHVKRDSYNISGFYLLQGSVINLSTCSKGFVQMFVIQGSQNFKTFIDQTGNTFNGQMCNPFIGQNCFPYIDYFEYKDNCHGGEFKSFKHYKLEKTDLLYFVSVSLLGDTLVYTNISIKRTVYKIDGARDICQNETECHFLFSDLSDSFGVVIQRNDNAPNNFIKFETRCFTRTWIYILLFVVSPFIISFIGSCFIRKFCRAADESTILRGNIQSQSYDTFPSLGGARLPSYREVANLPTYNEAVAGYQE